MKTVFVEDEQDHWSSFRQTLSTFPQIQLMGEAHSIESGYDLIRKVKPDLVLLDVMLQPGTSFEILNRLRQDGRIEFEIIFLTAYMNSEHVVRAIQYAALDFIYKPLEVEKLKVAIERAEQKIAEKKSMSQYQEQIHLLLQYLMNGSEKRKPSGRMAFHRRAGNLEFVNVHDIVYCQADNGVTIIVMKDKKSNFTARHPLIEYAKLLEAEYNFFRISDKELVNLDYLRGYSHHEDCKLQLTTGEELYASRRGGKELKLRLNEPYQVPTPKTLPLPAPDTNQARALLNFMKNFFKR
jgi:two-component system, LytTR family, response regulator